MTASARDVLRPVHEITRMRIHASEGELGHVHDVYFADTDWSVRYFHVDTRHWLAGRHLLLAPSVVRSVDWDGGRIHVALTRERVLNAPDITAHTPMSRHQVARLDEYVQLPFSSWEELWHGEALRRLHTLLVEMHPPEAAPSPWASGDDQHLWSARAVCDYVVEGDEGELGRAADFLLDPDAWALHYIAVEKWTPFHASRSLVPVDAVHRISRETKRVWVETSARPDTSKRQRAGVAGHVPG